MKGSGKTMTQTVSTKGSIVIPSKIRTKLGIRPGKQVEII